MYDYWNQFSLQRQVKICEILKFCSSKFISFTVGIWKAYIIGSSLFCKLLIISYSVISGSIMILSWCEILKFCSSKFINFTVGIWKAYVIGSSLLCKLLIISYSVISGSIMIFSWYNNYSKLSDYIPMYRNAKAMRFLLTLNMLLASLNVRRWL